MNRIIKVLCGLGVVALLAACGGEELGYEDDLTGKADRILPEKLTWAPDPLPVATCTLGDYYVHCSADEDFNQAPMNNGRTGHQVEFSILTDPTTFGEKDVPLEVGTTLNLPLRGATGKITIVVNGMIRVLNVFNSENDGASLLSYEASYVLSEDNPSVDISAPFDIWRVKLISEKITKVEKVYVEAVYTIEEKRKMSTAADIKLNGGAELQFITDKGADALNGQVFINKVAVSIPEPGFYTVMPNRELRPTKPSDGSF